MLALVSTAAASSSSLAAARSSALAPTPLIDRAASSNVAAVESIAEARASPSFFTPATDEATSRRPAPVDSCPSWISLAVSATWACARASDWTAVALSSIPAASDSSEARISSLPAACSLPLAASRAAASSIVWASVAVSRRLRVVPFELASASSRLNCRFPFGPAALLLFAMSLLPADHLREIDQHQ